jgi:hypothetical protein
MSNAVLIKYVLRSTSLHSSIIVHSSKLAGKSDLDLLKDPRLQSANTVAAMELWAMLDHILDDQHRDSSNTKQASKRRIGLKKKKQKQRLELFRLINISLWPWRCLQLTSRKSFLENTSAAV